MTKMSRVSILAMCLAFNPGRPANGEPPEVNKGVRLDFYGDPLPADALVRLGTLRHRYLHRFGCVEQVLTDGKTTLSSTAEEIRWVDLPKGRLTRTWLLPKGFAACGFSSDGQLVMLADAKTAELWELPAGKKLRTLQTQGWLRQGDKVDFFNQPYARFSADKKTVAATFLINAIPGLLRVWDADTGRELWQLGKLGDANGRSLCGFLPDNDTLILLGRLLAVKGHKAAGAGDEAFLAFFDADSGRKMRWLDMTLTLPIFNPDGRFLAGVYGGEVLFLDVAAGQVRQTLPADSPFSLAYSPDGRTLACGNTDAILLYELASAKERCRIELPFEPVRVCQFSPDGRWIAATRKFNDDREIFLCDAHRGQKVHSFTGHDGGVAALTFTPDSRRLVSASYDTTLLVWDIAAVAEKLPKAQAQPDEKTLAAAWNDLAGADAKAAYRAIGIMIDGSTQSPAFFRQRLRPTPPTDAKQIQHWLTALDSEQFDKRQQATRRLEQIGGPAEPALTRLLKGRPSLEARRRAEHILQKLRGPISDLQLLRALRAVEVLEFIASPEAKQVLKMLGQGDPEARLTQEAQASVRRLDRRAEAKP